MANAYGTKEYLEYRQSLYKQNDKDKWYLVDVKRSSFEKYKIEYEYLCRESEYEQYQINRMNAELRCEMTVYKFGKLCYECNDVYNTRCFYFTHNSNDFILFCKDKLYGYTILNLDTLDEINYFPSNIVDNWQKNSAESFIIYDAMKWNDVLLLEGCFWAGPTMCCLFDLNTFKTYLIDNEEWRSIADNGISVNDDVLTLRYEDEEMPASSSYTYEQVKALLQASTSCDLPTIFA